VWEDDSCTVFFSLANKEVKIVGNTFARRWGIVALASALFVFSIYQVNSYYLDEFQNNKKIDQVQELYYSNRNQPIEQYIPINNDAVNLSDHSIEINEAVPKTVQERFKQLLQTNEDIVGWVRIDNTKIDYPVLQSEDNDFYLKHDIQKDKNINGSIFMDYRNNIETKNRHIIIYGHNMKNRTMFASLLNYESRWYLEQHPIIEFDTLYGDEKWEIFSVHFTTTDYDYLKTDFIDDDHFRSYIDDLQKKSLHKSQVELSDKDVVLTLSTCSTSSDQARFAVHARLITNH
jgi:sortase B